MEGQNKMGGSVQELKHAARLQEWSVRVAECRSSGIGVKTWCAEQGIALKTYYNWERQIVKTACKQYALPGPGQRGPLTRIDPYQLPGDECEAGAPGITIRHGESSIILPAGVNAESIAELVKALNRHA